MRCFYDAIGAFAISFCAPQEPPPPPPPPAPIVTTCKDSRTGETYIVHGDDVIDSGITSSGIWVRFRDTLGTVRMMTPADAPHVKCVSK